MAPALLAAALALLVHALGLSGTDEAAQSYRVSEVRVYGLVLWDSGWYGGNLPLGYSVVFPLIGALTGLVVAGVASAAAATYAFDRLVVSVWGRRGPAAWYMAISTTLPVAIGQLPYLSGEAFGLLALLALRHRHRTRAVLLVAASTLCSPLAGAFTALACLAVAADHRVQLLALLRLRLGGKGTTTPQSLGEAARTTTGDTATRVGATGSGTARTETTPTETTPTETAGTGTRALTALGCAAAALALIGGLTLAFPNSGPFPFPASGLELTLLFCAVAATPILPMPSVLRWAAAGYALACVVSFSVPNDVGGNAVRLAQSVGVPVMVAVATLGRPGAAGGPILPWPRPAGRLPAASEGAVRQQPAPERPVSERPFPGQPVSEQPVPGQPSGPKRLLARLGGPRKALHGTISLLVVGGFATWQWGPGLNVLESPPAVAAASESFYQPLLHQIERRSSGPVRVEAVPTVNHWESAYLAPTVSLARGWERQLDVADNPLFYRAGPLRASSYVAWLRANGVTWVALPVAKLDYASRAEAALLRGGRVAGLERVWSSAHWRLWRVVRSPGLVSGPGRIVKLNPDHLSVSVRRPAVLTIRVRYTDLWGRVGDRGPADCVRPTRAGWTQVVAHQAGTLRLVVKVLADRDTACPSS